MHVDDMIMVSVDDHVVEPPSMFELAARLRSRATEDAAEVDQRLRVAEREMAARGEFDARLVNTDVGETARALLELCHSWSD